LTSRPAHFFQLLRFLRRKGRSREDAEDLIQEAMMRLHVYGQTVPVVNEEAFLRHALHNLSVDQYRRDRLDLRLKVPIDDLNASTPLVDPDSTPDQRLDTQQRLHRISDLLDSVGRRTRDIYFAHRAGYSYAEIAEYMGISHITIRRHIARALLIIMEEVELDDGIANPEAE
jgi:RNA polymerase sigma factor (sigma-70 family)